MLAEVGQVTIELSITKGTDHTVSGHYPVALGCRSRSNAHNWAGYGRGGDVTEALGGTVAVNLAVRGDQPVPVCGQVDGFGIGPRRRGEVRAAP